MVKKWSELKRLTPDEIQMRSASRAQRQVADGRREKLKSVQWKVIMAICVLLAAVAGLFNLHRLRLSSQPPSPLAPKPLKRSPTRVTWRSLLVKRKGLRRVVPPFNFRSPPFSKERSDSDRIESIMEDMKYPGRRYRRHKLPFVHLLEQDLSGKSAAYREMVARARNIDPDLLEAYDLSQTGYYRNALMYYQRVLDRVDFQNYIVLNFIYRELASLFGKLGNEKARLKAECKLSAIRQTLDGIVIRSGDYRPGQVTRMEEDTRKGQAAFKRMIDRYQSMTVSARQAFEENLRQQYGSELDNEQLTLMIFQIRFAAR